MANDYEGSTLELDKPTIDQRIDRILSDRSIIKTDRADAVLDSSWVKESMISKGIEYDPDDLLTRFYTTADKKFQDTTIGGNFVINPRPQFTRYADPRSKGLLPGREDQTLMNFKGNIGMGHYYSEAIDDTHQTIHMRFGIPEYNSFINFFTSFYDNDTARLSRSGSLIQDFTYMLMKPVGFVLNIIFWPLMAAHAVGSAYRFFAQKPASKYYYLRPTMTNYWTAVTTMLNQLLVYKQIFPFNADQSIPAEGGGLVDSNVMAQLRRILPNFFQESNFIDVYSIANRGQRIRNVAETAISQATKGMTADQLTAYAKSIGSENASIFAVPPGRSLKEASEAWFSSKLGRAEPGKDTMEREVRTPLNPTDTTPGSPPSDFMDHLEAEFMDGAQFATFRVDSTGAVDESFSNTTVESDISQKFNSISASAKSAMFSTSGGNTGIFGVDQALQAAKGIVEGALDWAHMSGLMSLAGAAFVDIPKHWDNSSANMPKMSYSMQLVSPYGNPISQMINIYIPMCMILAAALPLSTGKQSYTSPFLLELYDQGKAQTRLGIIDSLSFVRGTTNLGFSKNKNFMSVDVTFTVADLSSVMHMPLTSGFSLNPLKGIMDEDTVYTDYLHVLAAATLGQSIYPTRKLRDNLLVKWRSLEAWTSPARWAGIIHEKTPLGLIDMFVKGTDRR